MRSLTERVSRSSSACALQPSCVAIHAALSHHENVNGLQQCQWRAQVQRKVPHRKVVVAQEETPRKHVEVRDQLESMQKLRQNRETVTGLSSISDVRWGYSTRPTKRWCVKR